MPAFCIAGVLRGFLRRQDQRRGVGKDRAAAVQTAEPAVQTLDGVGSIHDLPRGLGELEHGADAVLIVDPAVHAAGIFGIRHAARRGVAHVIRHYPGRNLSEELKK